MHGARALLACFLVLNLLLSGMPVQALAADAMPIPEVTAAEETIPETTAAEETVPAETMPEITEPEESLPEETPAQLTEEPEQSGPGLYFGRLGGHSTVSSGTDAPEALYQQAQADSLDFFGLSDHGDSIHDADWASLKAAADAASSGSFLGLFGYEMNWPRNMQIGHISTFGTDDFISWQQAGFDQYEGALENYYEVLASCPGSVSRFNHPGTQYGTFDDFGHYSPEADRAMTLLEIDFDDRDPFRYYNKALQAGWHLAPSGEITAVYAQALTEKALYDGLRNCRAYATEDPDLEILYDMNGHAMGSRLERRHVGDSLEISVFLHDPTDDAAGTVEVVSGGGAVAAVRTLNGPEGTLQISLPVEDGYYYLRITQPDGHRAVTAPIWVDGQEDLGITGLRCETGVPVRNEPVSLTMEFSNRETADFRVESAEILADGQVILTNSEGFRIPAGSETEHSFSFVSDCVGLTEITLRLSGTLEGSPRIYEATLTLSFHQSTQVTGILVDAGHGNAGLDSLNTLTALARKENIQVTQATDITPEMLKECRFLLISPPSEPFSGEFVEMIREFAGYGGSLILCGQADMLDENFSSGAELTRLLSAIGSSLGINGDTVRDPVTNGGESHRLYPDDVNLTDAWCAGVTEDQVYRMDPGCSIDPGDGTWLVRGRSTTQPENAVVLAWEALSGGGSVFAAGSLFLSDEDLEAPKNFWDLPYANRTIARNLLGIGGDAVSVSTIAQARAAEDQQLVRLRGHVTAGNTNRYNTFPDTIYLQDDTGGIAVVPFPAERVQVGTGLEVMGFVQTQNGNRVLKLSDWQVLEGDLYHCPPRTGDWEELLDPALNGGSLVEVEGKCLEIYCREDDTLAGCLLEDGEGNTAIIQIDGYISAGSDGENDLHKEICKGRTVRAMGILHVNDYGETVLRVRNCEEVDYVPPRRYYNPRTGDALLPSAVTAMAVSLAGLILLRRKYHNF